MEELSEKIGQVLAAVAAASAAQNPGSRQRVTRQAVVRKKDGSQESIEVTADLRLGVGDDPTRLTEIIRQAKDWDVEAVEMPKPLPHKEVLQWSEQLSQAFFKAWSQRAELVDFVEKACECGEGLLAGRQPALAYSEVYLRFSDRCLELRTVLEASFKKGTADDARARKVASVARFYLGRCMALYQQTIRRDDGARRRDTVETLRDVLKDVLQAVQFVNLFDVSLREELYWALYNSCVMALRASRWLRLQGFPSYCVRPLTWLMESLNACLPMMAVHMVPLRVRFLLELVYCAEAAMQLGEASRLCDAAVTQLEKDRQLELMIEPVPEETVQVFDAALLRFKVLKIKYDFWTEKVVGDAKAQAPMGTAQVVAAADALRPKGECVLPCLLELLEFRHGLPTQFGTKAADTLETEGAPGQADHTAEGASEAPVITRISLGKIRGKQQELLEAILERAKPHMETAESAIKALEDFTARRLEFEAEVERRARSDEAAVTKNEAGEDVPAEPPVAPARPDKAGLEALGFQHAEVNHDLERMLPLATHLVLARECLRHELQSGGASQRGKFKQLERSLALRLRYRHFLCPPLIDVDVLVTGQRDRSKVGLPDKYDFLTDDLNAQSQLNRQAEAESAVADSQADGRPGTAASRPGTASGRGRGKHVFVIGRRFDAWESWTRGGVAVSVRRLSNLRVAFAAHAGGASPRAGCGLFDAGPFTGSAGGGPAAAKGWDAPYASARASDSSGFDITDKAVYLREALLQEFRQMGHLKNTTYSLPIDPHPGAQVQPGVMPFLHFGIYDEGALWTCDEEAQKTLSFSAVQTLLAAPAGAEGEASEAGEAAEGESGPHVPVLQALQDADADAGALLPPWCQLLDNAEMATSPIADLSIFSTKHLHAPARGLERPEARFNALIRTDLRQTPSDLLGRPFQSYIFACAAVSAPAPALVFRELMLLRALEAVHTASAAAAGGRTPPAQEPAEGEAAEAAPEPWRRPAVMDRLCEFSDLLCRTMQGSCGQLFLLDAADKLEDLCSCIFLKWIWPRLKAIQDAGQLHEHGERVISDEERLELDAWAAVIRQVLPVLLRVLEQVKAVDAMTLGAAAFALARLFHDANDSRSGQAELGMAIARLEDEIAETSIPGPQPRLDLHVASVVSFDPPALRPPSAALFEGEAPEDAAGAETLILKRSARQQQERICLLTTLYTSWIDISLKAHLKNVGSTVRRTRQPGEGPEEDYDLGAGAESAKLALSNQEAAVLARLGENPYLRCLFCVTIARRRPEATSAALAKACAEVQAAVTQERQLWEHCEQELCRQQRTIRSEKKFGEEFTDKNAKKAGRKPRAHPPLPFGRSPGGLRLRMPPLLQGAVPPLLPSSIELSPEEQAFEAAKHSEGMGHRLACRTVLTAAVFGKPAGTGTSVSELHRDLPGTGLRRYGYDYVEVTGLKPNKNYTFATMYFEGFEASRPAASTMSETCPPVGTYYPLPIALLRVEICKQALLSGAAGEAAWNKAWTPLFDSFCERTTKAEEFDSCGLRTFKLRLDVVDRLPPAVLAAFAELVLLKNGNYGAQRRTDTFPATKSVQQAALRAANECLIAADCARRASHGYLTLQGVSLALKTVERLLQYRTKPPVLLTLLTKCAACLEGFAPTERELTWYAKARVMATYLFHHIAVLSVQLRQKSALVRTLQGDVPLRYAPHTLADSAAQAVAKSRLLDQALELALLGPSGFWTLAEAKAKVALDSNAGAEEMMQMLRDISNREYVKAAADAVQKVLATEAEGRQPLALVLMRAAVTRTWQKDETQEALRAVLDGHPLGQALEQLLAERREAFTSFGYMLRALPPICVQPDPAPPAEGEDGEESAPRDGSKLSQPESAGGASAPAAATAEGTEDAAEGEVPAPKPAEVLAESEDAAGLAQLELMRVGPTLQELCSIRFHWQDISRFQFFDLQQVAVPELSQDGATLGGVERPGHDKTRLMGGGEDAAEEGAEGDDAEPDAWRAKELEDQRRRARAFELLKELLPRLVRGAAYASAKRADQLLQMMLLVGLNALLIVGPSPAECVPSGPQSNPQDIDPDGKVGADLRPQDGAEGEAAAAEEGKEAGSTSDIWLNLALLAELAVATLTRLKAERTPPAAHHVPSSTRKKATTRPAATNRTRRPPSKDPEEVPAEEAQAIQVAQETSRDLGAADEELHEMWFDDMPELDLTSIAKLVAFAVLCLYHMRRWNNVIVLCRSFNDATCFVFATTFLPLLIGAQSQVSHLSERHVSNTQRYLAESKATFEADQKKLPRKLLRQLALQGELSEPEKLFNKRTAYYQVVAKRQRKLDDAWRQLLQALESSYALVAKAVPAAVEQLRKSRMLMAEFLQQRQAFGVRLARGLVTETERLGKERSLKLGYAALTTSYRKAVELLRKRQLADLVVQALHELGNLQWLEGDVAGAQTSWSDAVDAAYQYVYSIKNWQKCVETAVTPPTNATRVEIMLLSVVILAKHARLTTPKDSSAHLAAALFASGIVEAVLASTLPHPSHRTGFSLDRYRMREIFVGLRESRLLLPPNSVHGGVDGTVFLSALSFFVDTLLVAGYQQARSLPMCSLYNYVATDVCRSAALATKGRLLMVRALVRSQSLEAAWFGLHRISKGHDQPRQLLSSEALDLMVAEAPDGPATLSGAGAGYSPFRVHEEPFSEHNKQAIAQLLDLTLVCGEEAQRTPADTLNMHTFQLLQADFLVSLCSCAKVAKVGDPVQTERLGYVDKAAERLRKLWKEVTGNDDDVDAVSGADNKDKAIPSPTKSLDEKEGELCVDIRLLLARCWELKGDLSRAVAEVLYAMRYVRLLASTSVKTNQDCNMGGTGQLRGHPGAKVWAVLRRQMAQLLVNQGRYKAADAHIEQGLQECQAANDDISRIELLASKVRVDVLQGKLLEFRGSRRSGALPVARCCVALAAKRLPTPPSSAIVVKAVLSLLLEQNPTLQQLDAAAPAQNVAEQLAEVIAGYGKNDDPNETLLLNAQGKIVPSPIAQAMQAAAKAKDGGAVEGLGAAGELEGMMSECLRELDVLLQVRGFTLHPHNMNNLFHISGDSSAVPPPLDLAPPAPPPDPKAKAAPKAAAAPPPAAATPAEEPGEDAPDGGLLPALKAKARKRPVSDSRESPNLYYEFQQLRLHCELRLARLKLDRGAVQEAEVLLKEAECRMGRCVALLPWLYVQFCLLKLQWRRLTHQLGLARQSPPADAPNDAVYRDPKAFADARCPATDSPLFRTFVQRAGKPSLMLLSEWVPQAGRDAEEELSHFLAEVTTVLQLAVKEGGHDYGQVSALLREALEELLRVRRTSGPVAEDAPKTADIAFGLFSALVSTAVAKKALLFETGSAAATPAVPDPKAKDAKGAPPAGQVDAAQLPARVALDILNGLKRQGSDRDEDLAYSGTACQEAQKSLPSKTVVKHAFSLRRECETFGSIYHDQRLLSDALHLALTTASSEYAQRKVLDEASLAALAAPAAGAPASGDVLAHWARPDVGSLERPPSQHRAYFVYICPPPAVEGAEGEPAKPEVARCNDVALASLRRLADELSSDLARCRPAEAVAAALVELRLRTLAQVLRGASCSSDDVVAGADTALDAAVAELLRALAPAEAAAAGQLDAEKVQELLRASLALLDHAAGASKVSHLPLSAFLRVLLAPLSCLPT